MESQKTCVVPNTSTNTVMSEQIRYIFARNEQILDSADKAVDQAAQKMGVQFQAPACSTFINNSVQKAAKA